MIHPEAERLAKAWIGHFWASNREITWKAIEQEAMLWLDKRTVLVGKQDALGVTPDGIEFFGDWKTASISRARNIKNEKARWRMSPQALTYGVLNSSTTRHFTVRWSLKTAPATCDFEWYSYTTEELVWWRGELLESAQNIRELRARRNGQWPTNLTNCTRYGEQYRCPFRDEGCHALNFNFQPDSMKPRTQSHLAIENEIKAKIQRPEDRNYGKDVVVLDASRMHDWLGCKEHYRRLWEGDGLTEENENLTIGTHFHELVGAHLTQIKNQQEKQL